LHGFVSVDLGLLVAYSISAIAFVAVSLMTKQAAPLTLGTKGVAP
jgi:hypothetical protein